MAKDTNEIGYAIYLSILVQCCSCYHRLRIGLGYFATSFAMLTGTPIDGALLGHALVLHWTKPIVFSAVRSLAFQSTGTSL